MNLKADIRNINKIQGTDGACQGQAVARDSECGSLGAAQVPLRESLEKKSFELHHQQQRVDRARQILQEHPEFEQLLELQELINRGLYY